MPSRKLALVSSDPHSAADLAAVEAPTQAPQTPARLVGAQDALEARPSPAQALQQRLVEGWEEHEAGAPAKWPLALSLFAAAGAALGLWALIFWGAARLFS